MTKRERTEEYHKFLRRKKVEERAWNYFAMHGAELPINTYPHLVAYKKKAKDHEFYGELETVILVPRKDYDGYKVFMGNDRGLMLETVMEVPL